MSRGGPFPTSNAEIEQKWGGRNNYIGIFEDFYFNFMTDPFMNELFDTRSADVAVSHKEHAKRLGLFFLGFMGDDSEYN